MYPLMALPVHTFIPINRLDLPVNVSTALHVHRCTCSSLYCSICPQMYLFITILFYMSTDIPVHLNTVLHVHRCTCSSQYCSACPQMYLFITILFYMSTDVPVHHYTVLHVHRCTCSSLYLFSLFLLFRHNVHNDLSTHLLGYLHTDATALWPLRLV